MALICCPECPPPAVPPRSYRNACVHQRTMVMLNSAEPRQLDKSLQPIWHIQQTMRDIGLECAYCGQDGTRRFSFTKYGMVACFRCGTSPGRIYGPDVQRGNCKCCDVFARLFRGNICEDCHECVPGEECLAVQDAEMQEEYSYFIELDQAMEKEMDKLALLMEKCSIKSVFTEEEIEVLDRAIELAEL